MQTPEQLLRPNKKFKRRNQREQERAIDSETENKQD